jgi:hypothetical protein
MLCDTEMKEYSLLISNNRGNIIDKFPVHGESKRMTAAAKQSANEAHGGFTISLRPACLPAYSNYQENNGTQLRTKKPLCAEPGVGALFSPGEVHRAVEFEEARQHRGTDVTGGAMINEVPTFRVASTLLRGYRFRASATLCL